MALLPRLGAALLGRRAPGGRGARSPASRGRLALIGLLAAMALGATWWLRGGGQESVGQPLADLPMVLQVRERILAAGLTHDAPECLAFRIDPEVPGRPTALDVLEKHTARCGGEPAPLRLFGVRVDRATAAMWDDARAPGTFVPLP